MLGHLVERLCQPAELVSRLNFGAALQVAGGHCLGGIDQRGQRPGDAARDPVAEQDRAKRQRQGDAG